MFGQTGATLGGALLFLILILLDIWGALDSKPGNTPSELIRWLSRYTAIIPWALGVLLGHWFHPWDGLDGIFGSASTWVLIGVSVVVLAARIFFRQKPLWDAWIWAALGVLAGTFLWPV